MLDKTSEHDAVVSSDFELDPSKLSEADLNDGGMDTDVQPEVEAKDGLDLSSLVLKFNGKEIKASELSAEDLKAHIQKGMNYDHILAERDSLKNSEELSTIRDLAKEDGKDVKTFLNELKNGRQQQKIEQRAKELEAEGYKPEHALKTAEMELKLKAVEPKQPSTEETYQKEFETLLNTFPEAKEFKEFKDFPESVRTAISEGTPPLVAYAKYRLEQAEAEKQAILQEAEAKKRATPSLNESKEKEDNDEFRNALFG